MIKELNSQNFESEVLNSKDKVVIDFYANWCGPCRMLRPILEDLSQEIVSCKFASINIDEEEELAEKYGIASIPCLVMFKDGKEINRSIGLKSKEDLKQILGE